MWVLGTESKSSVRAMSALTNESSLQALIKQFQVFIVGIFFVSLIKFIPGW